jgi:hypothetical protein
MIQKTKMQIGLVLTLMSQGCASYSFDGKNSGRHETSDTGDVDALEVTDAPGCNLSDTMCAAFTGSAYRGNEFAACEVLAEEYLDLYGFEDTIYLEDGCPSGSYSRCTVRAPQSNSGFVILFYEQMSNSDGENICDEYDGRYD